jgi:hypothetical protein
MSQDLFAAFGSEERVPSATSQSSAARHNPAGPPKPLDLEAILNAKPYDESTTTNTVTLNDDDDDDDDEFGDFEDASPMDADTKAAILKARMGSPMPNMEMPFFEVPTTKPVSPNKSRTSSKPVTSPYKSRNTEPARSSPSSSRAAPVSNLPFKPKPAGPIHVPISSSRASAASKPVKNLPFKPKPVESKSENIGSHPFAGRMDMLFDIDDDDYDAGADDLNVDLANDPEAAMAYSKRLIADAMAHQKPQASPAPRPELPKQDVKREPNKLRKFSAYAPAKNLDVLFDADNLSDNHDDDDDDWGTFESGSAEPAKAYDTTKNATKSSGDALGLDLLGLDDTSAQWATSQEPVHATTAISQNKLSKVQPIQDDDAWDDFESVAPSTAPTPTVPSLPKSTINIAAPANPANTSSLPPTNIPPPAILLSVFPSLITSAQGALFDTLAKLPQDQKQELLSHEATHQFLRGYIGLSIVLAHIISGRKQRWKRDQFLAQGMRIGPAAAGGKGGMKLTGVDKSEAAKEDREVLDAVRQWRSVVGKLRSAVSGANVKASAKLPPIPEISEQMPVKVLKITEGGIVASHACALCGLRREERVSKVDEGVDDSFGEWWVQGMNMHLLCKNFWDSHSEQMRSR